jgi:hypothetical protein
MTPKNVITKELLGKFLKTKELAPEICPGSSSGPVLRLVLFNLYIQYSGWSETKMPTGSVITYLTKWTQFAKI